MIDIPPSVLPEHTASVRRAMSGLPHEVRAEGRESTIRAVWIELADRAGVTSDGDTGAAAALAGLAAGLTMA